MDEMSNENCYSETVLVTKLTEERLLGVERLKALREFFVQQYDAEPSYFVRVPGRVNIIGEHIDYCGYPVLPMAIEQSILLAVRIRHNDSMLQLSNVNEKFQSFKCDLDSISIDIPKFGGPEWYKYFLCGIRGILEHIGGDFRKLGMIVAVSGNIPPSSGLSSSSALVSSATLATACAYNVNLDKKALASISAKCERYIGTQGGGMDQAIAYLAKQGCAQFIEFHPELKATSVELPKNVYFVVANSLAEINKAATSDFNERVIECRISARLLAKRLHFTNWRDITRLATLQMAIECSLEELEELTEAGLTRDLYSRENLVSELNVSQEDFEEHFLTPNTKHLKFFKLRQRSLHVIQEAIRVWQFRETCEADCSALSIELLSECMQESHKSLRFNYECSHPSLDRLIEISESLGIGARLTGAGWGGCIVALCDSLETCDKYIAALKERYYKHLPQAKTCDMENVIFATSPQSGAEIFTFSYPNNGV